MKALNNSSNKDNSERGLKDLCLLTLICLMRILLPTVMAKGLDSPTFPIFWLQILIVKVLKTKFLSCVIELTAFEAYKCNYVAYEAVFCKNAGDSRLLK